MISSSRCCCAGSGRSIGQRGGVLVLAGCAVGTPAGAELDFAFGEVSEHVIQRILRHPRHQLHCHPCDDTNTSVPATICSCSSASFSPRAAASHGG